MKQSHARSSVFRRRARRALVAGLSLSIAVGTLTGVGAGIAAPARAATGDPFDPAVPTVFIAQGTPTQLYNAETSGDGSYIFSAEGLAAPVRHYQEWCVPSRRSPRSVSPHTIDLDRVIPAGPTGSCLGRAARTIGASVHLWGWLTLPGRDVCGETADHCSQDSRAQEDR